MLHAETNDGLHIAAIISSTTCKKHKADSTKPCWYIHISSKQEAGLAVCGARIKRAGFNGTIDPSSLRKSSGRSSGRKART